MNLLDKANKLRAKANDRAVTGQEKAILLAKAEELEKKHRDNKYAEEDRWLTEGTKGTPTDMFGGPVKPKQEMSEREKREYWAKRAKERHWVDEDMWLTDEDLEFSVYVDRTSAHGRSGRNFSVGEPDSIYEERWKYDGQ